MRLTRLRVVRSPGLEAPFELTPEQLDRPCVLIVGPNASGKSSLCRAIRALLWPDAVSRSLRLELEAGWYHDGHRLEATHHPDAGTRWWSAQGIEVPPPALPPAHLARCFAPRPLDLLKADLDAEDDQLTSLVRRQLAGGYDPDRLLETCFAPSPRGGMNELKRYRETRDRVTRLRRDEEALAEREAAIDARREGVERARQAAREAERLERQRRLVEVRRERREGEQRVEREFPEGMDLLDGSEGDRLEDLRRQASQIDGDVREQQERASEARRDLARSDLPEALPDPVEIQVHRDLARTAAELERALRDRATRRAGAARARDQARRALGASLDAEQAPVVSDEALERVESVGAELDQQQARRAQLVAELDVLPEELPDEEGSRFREQAEPLLAAWLAAPRPAAAPWGLALCAALAGLGLAATWAWLAESIGGSAWWVVAAALALVGAGAAELLWRVLRAGAERRRLEQRIEALPIPAPGSWSPEGVAARLDEVRRQRADDARALQQIGRRRQLVRQLGAVDASLEALGEEADRLRERYGIRVPAAPARTATLLRQLADWQRTTAELASIDAERDEQRREQGERLDRLARFLERHGCETPADAAEAERRLEDLASRVEQAQRARAIDQQAREKLEELNARRREVERERVRLFERAGLEVGDEAGLRQRLERLGAYREELQELRRLRREESEQETELGDDVPGDDADPAALAAERDERNREAEQAEALLAEIHQVRALVEQARRGEQLQEALTERDAALAELEDRRDELARRAAGSVLVRHVIDRHRLEQQPGLLRDASGWLARFTRYRYELELAASADGGGLQARDADSGRPVPPSQLSDGTRAQLLLALRLAFARSVESGAPLPLLLDEALVSSDPERFDAIAGSLVDLAVDERRQVVFLTADPQDAARWNARIRERGLEPAEPIDLLAVREGQRATAFPLPTVPPREELAAPSPGEPAEGYARRLGVPAPDPWTNVDAWHPLHLWPDDLDSVHALAGRGLDSLGRWRAYRRQRPGDPGPLDAELARRLDADVVIAEAVVQGWRIGRGRPLDREVLARAESVSERFVDPLWRKAAGLDRDAGALIDALRRREVRNFRQEKTEQLEQELESGGHLDRREPLPREALIARARTALEARRLQDAGFDAVVHRVDTILSWLR